MSELIGFGGGIVLMCFIVSLFVPAWMGTAMWIYKVFEVSAGVLFFVCVAASPALLFRRARSSLATLYLFSSLVFAAFLWAECCLYVLSLWGRIWLFWGVFAGGIGVIPEALVACVFARQWPSVVEIPMVIGMIVLMRFGVIAIAKTPPPAAPAPPKP